MKKILILELFIIIFLVITNYKTIKQSQNKNLEIIKLKNKNTKLKQSLDSLKIFFLKQDISDSDKQVIKDYIQNLIKKRNNTFLPDISPIKSEYIISQKYSHKHPAIDLATEKGTEVLATATGVVDSTYFDKYFGNTIIIDHLNGFKTKYAHLAKILATKNYCVRKSDVIGLVGSTGRSSAPHLHYEILKNNKNINPLKFIQREN